ncbi:acetate/propionate family kinase [uncultured Thiodictyon sp.]|jgi:acetate kinase|uniref:acetate/propionate family kinase n=1 Tax=uncultured Thiodictyon sp. TaxID=1846217 RepID=UPI0025CB91A5|nr:acetate/propionate family kinase [uncultured Thiodictyon sp.]
MSDAILVVNAGSSSIKFSVFLDRYGERAIDPLLSGQLEGVTTAPRFRARDAAGTLVAEQHWTQPLGHDGAVEHIAGFLREPLSAHRLAAVGHRVVHGGLAFAAPVRLTPAIVAQLEQLIPLAPLHQPHNLAPIKTLLTNHPNLPQVACFDTAFHRGQTEIAQAFALPPVITERGVRRYGFHGLSYEYVASVLPDYDARAAQGRTVVLHLGNGASACAIADGKSVASSMGFTAVDGLPMGTRCGNLDPGVLLYLMDQMQMDARAIEKLIYKESGLLGVSGVSSDMRTLLESAEPRAQFAIELFVYRIALALGSLAAALGGLDAIIFTAGIGEHAAPIRERVCRAAAWLGVTLDPAANNAAKGAARISTADSRTAAWVIPTNEELMIAGQTRDLLSRLP